MHGSNFDYDADDERHTVPKSLPMAEKMISLMCYHIGWLDEHAFVNRRHAALVLRHWDTLKRSVLAGEWHTSGVCRGEGRFWILEAGFLQLGDYVTAFGSRLARHPELIADVDGDWLDPEDL